MTVIDEIISSNQKYAASFDKGSLPMPPGRKIAIVTCMDARITPESAFGIAEGDAHVIRNAGGRAPEALRSLVISEQLLGTQTILLVQHTDCGMLTFTNDDIRNKIKNDLHVSADHIDFLPFPEVRQNIKDDVKFLKDSPLIPDSINIHGYVFEVETGKLVHIA